ncbi:hypothetical protein ECP02989426_3263 [Escherichia coli P0298942.6]|nr:hypothetical protein EC2845350_3369 [Escherichia coli 2845350]ENB46648.1 hypothetical protein ECP029894211_3356 [Escherichia coli P0298942.11]ENB59786.1 hypothetical protein ECP02989426_3263 [Escherichia coli P0298942.6]ENB90049.1 hypothetical protein ECP02989428_5050 [Escherichia coli P0298942.8]END65064.1 hypothetical protein ECP02989423_3449 [Escherichia coli P0298942.3]
MTFPMVLRTLSDMYCLTESFHVPEAVVFLSCPAGDISCRHYRLYRLGTSAG